MVINKASRPITKNLETMKKGLKKQQTKRNFGK
jgi:hypothetical protein